MLMYRRGISERKKKDASGKASSGEKVKGGAKKLIGKEWAAQLELGGRLVRFSPPRGGIRNIGPLAAGPPAINRSLAPKRANRCTRVFPRCEYSYIPTISCN